MRWKRVYERHVPILAGTYQNFVLSIADELLGIVTL